jgi:hypothetical protein
MLKTLGLGGDGDDVELVAELEKAFDLKLSNDEAAGFFKVGELFDLLKRKMDAGEANRKCASAMAFYRIRRALHELGADVGRSPSAGLSLLHRMYTKSFVKSLGERSGLRLPRPESGPIGMTGIAVVLIAFFAGIVALVLAGAAGLVLLVAGFVVGWILMRIDEGRLPTNCRTLGDLAVRTAALSYGRLVKQGADARDGPMWKALSEILADFAGVPPDQIGRETFFLQCSPRGAESAA